MEWRWDCPRCQRCGLTLSGTGAGNSFAAHTLDILAGGTVTIAGMVELDAGVNAITNAGTLNLSGTQIGHGFNTAGALTLTNNATLNKTGAGTFTLGNGSGNVNFINAGTTNVNEGTLSHVIGSFVQNGDISLATGTTFGKVGSWVNAGTIGGVGVVNIGSGNTLTNNGTIRPGGFGSVGTLGLTGNFINGASGIIDIEVVGTTAGTGYDVFAISGTGVMGGTLKLTEINAWAVTTSDIYTPITCGTSCSGTFATALPTFGDQGSITVNAGNVQYVVTAAGFGKAWDGGAGDFLWQSAANWVGDTLPTSSDDVFIDTGAAGGPALITITSSSGAQTARRVLSYENLTLSGGSLALGSAASDNSTINGTFILAGGTLGGAGTLTVGNTFNWSGGTISGTGTTQIAQGANLNISTGVTINGSYTLANAGTINWTGTGNINLQNGAVINNSGLFLVRNDQAFVSAGGGASIVNSGIMEKGVGSGNTDFNIPLTSNGGTFTANTGLIRYNSSNTFNTGTTFNGATANQIISGATFGGVIGTSNLELAGGNYSGSFTLPAANTINWTGGSFTGANTLSIANGAVLNVLGAAQVTVNGGYTLANAGTINWSSSNNINVQNGGLISNTGLFSAQSNQALVSAGGGASFVNSGSFVKSVGAGNTDFNIPVVSNAGTFTAGSGTLRYNSTNTFNTGTIFNGAVVNQITSGATFDGQLVSSNLELAGGNYSGSFTLPAANTINWTGGSFTGQIP
ncbi:MAG: hypothetical protein IPJ25_07865 [Rhodocyclaceae bacterium]|nr:hypothetical protein [Rhodocyclaceae bacterium]